MSLDVQACAKKEQHDMSYQVLAMFLVISVQDIGASMIRINV